MKKRWMCLILAFCTGMLLTLPACAAQEGGERAAASRAFADVSEDAWYAEAVRHCTGQGWMSGTGEAVFSPEEPLTRAMLVTVLHRMAGRPAAAAASDFSDIAQGAWYSEAVAWAAAQGVVSGYGDGRFGAGDAVAREQLAAILWRYAGSPATGASEAFADEADISAWAAPAVRWARAGGVMDGKENNRFDPAAGATRAEVAAILYRWQEGPQTAAETLVLSIAGQEFPVALEDNASARALLARLPLTVTMDELNGNEKFYDLPEALPTAPETPGTIVAGDLMLYGADCLVLFYESFQSNYSYTRLGRIEDPAGLAQAVGRGQTEVVFQMRKPESKAQPFDFEMKTVTLNSGYPMPLNGLGTYSLHGDECRSAVAAALDSGVRLFDTAHAYGNETELGEAIRASGVPREEIFVITKLYPDQFAHAEAAIDEALQKLDIGYIDMMLLHHPGTGDVTAYKAIERAVAAGKVRSVGLSNWYVEELEAFLPQVDITPALVQNEIHPYYQENNVIPYIQDLGIVVQGWYPLGGRGHTAELLGDPVISAIAEAHGKSPAQVILRWNLQKGVVVIPGSSNPAHIRENTELYDFALTDGEMAQISALDRGEKHDWY